MPFDATDFTEFLFATGDCAYWSIASRWDVSTSGWYDNAEKTVYRSSASPSASYAPLQPTTKELD